MKTQRKLTEEDNLSRKCDAAICFIEACRKQGIITQAQQISLVSTSARCLMQDLPDEDYRFIRYLLENLITELETLEFLREERVLEM